ncbi:OLC1v1020631C1 [Oldenlandia corymbosa var. corymbosa]|uniref:aminopyrimidine aminohydrolase n=1 Tax=Oldenlandia corymbosa var. corymbosa TaxID=529605 RepID=A0AAV1EH07_OLDCO|nr:OLC1v1020631C1 [Oldenlandia corymbosa var. corymbosa]
MERKKEEEVGKVSVIETWLRKHRLVYIGATRHPFIHSIRDGTVDLSSFKLWLEQDYIFVRAFIPFVASVLIKASKESSADACDDLEVILGGMVALNDELNWFKKEASKWGVSLSNVTPKKANLKYCRLLERLASPEVEYTVAATAFWAIETVYQDSFAHCLEEDSNVPEDLKETCKRWGNDGFGQYCAALQTIAERCLEKSSEDERKKAEVVFLDILENEVEFWNMSQKDHV